MENILTEIGVIAIRYGLVLVLLWIGGMKFTQVEAEGIKPLAENSPFTGWLYKVMSVTGVAKLIGVIELITGLLIALRPVAPAWSGVGSLMAIITFLITLSYIFTTPGWEENLGFPALSVTPGQFLLKDVVLLGVAIWTAGEAFAAAGVL
jgi:uncharacterized membrane protein YkgB